MKLKLKRQVPWLLCGAVVLVAAVCESLSWRLEQFNLFRRLEWMTFDWRVRQAAARNPTNAPLLGLVDISDASIEALKSGELGEPVGLYWPRYVYGQLLDELTHQGATCIAFDVLFQELRKDHPPLPSGDRTNVPSDAYFAQQLRRAGNVILGAEKGVLPDDLFRSSAWAVGDISAFKDADGILRRARAFEDYRVWNPLIKQVARALAMDLRLTKVESNRIVLLSPTGRAKEIPLDSDGNFNQVALYEEFMGAKTAAGVKTKQPAFGKLRVWDMGVLMAARALELDLANAVVDEQRGRIVLRGAGGVKRVIPVDRTGRFLIDWSLKANSPALTQEPIESLLAGRKERLSGQSVETNGLWRGKIALIGSTALGDLTDLGATPLENNTYLTTRFLNVANAVITGRFIRQPGLGVSLALMAAFGAVGGILAWKWPALVGALSVVALSVAYTFVGQQAYLQSRLWVPLVFPVGTMWATFFGIITYRTIFEQRERRRIRGVFSKIVSPNVVNELLQAEKLSLGGARRRVTVLFADVRGFTQMTDETQARAEEQVKQNQLSPGQAEALYDERSQEVLATVNLYLGAVGDIVKKHDGTLDKYIGDCAMAFWGAPTPNERHAVTCVRAAIEIQRAVFALNEERGRENRRREQENQQRVAQGLAPLPLLWQLSLGTGINTGQVTVGLMGSDAHIVNFTVFGRDVNLASRLEGLSGRGRILIGEATYLDLQRDAPELAATCLKLDPATVKGFRTPVNVFEVPWSDAPAAAAAGAQTRASAPA